MADACILGSGVTSRKRWLEGRALELLALIRRHGETFGADGLNGALHQLVRELDEVLGLMLREDRVRVTVKVDE
jgi:hypothetical protein